MSVLKGTFYVGYLSGVGVLCWAAAAATCLFSCVLLREPPGGNASHAARETRRQYRAFLRDGGALTALLLLDDLFLIHDRVLPAMIDHGELVMILIEAALTATFMVRHGRLIYRNGPALLLTALGLFAMSLTIDLRIISIPLKSLLEDGSKLLGIAAWCGYLIRIAAGMVRACAWSTEASQWSDVHAPDPAFAMPQPAGADGSAAWSSPPHHAGIDAPPRATDTRRSQVTFGR